MWEDGGEVEVVLCWVVLRARSGAAVYVVVEVVEVVVVVV